LGGLCLRERILDCKGTKFFQDFEKDAKLVSENVKFLFTKNKCSVFSTRCVHTHGEVHDVKKMTPGGGVEVGRPES
jgi:hypothetical protein